LKLFEIHLDSQGLLYRESILDRRFLGVHKEILMAPEDRPVFEMEPYPIRVGFLLAMHGEGKGIWTSCISQLDARSILFEVLVSTCTMAHKLDHQLFTA
jgi:hypothetical protein